MKRALTKERIAEIERMSQLPVYSTYGAMSRDDYPTLNPPSVKCSGFVPDKEWVTERLRIAEDEFTLNPTYANKCRIQCFKMLLPLFIDELETIQ